MTSAPSRRPSPRTTQASEQVSTRTLSIGCEFVHQSRFEIPTIFQVEPRPDQDVEVVESAWSFEPDVASRVYTDLYDNTCRRTTISAGRSVISYNATVVVPDAVEDA